MFSGIDGLEVIPAHRIATYRIVAYKNNRYFLWRRLFGKKWMPRYRVSYVADNVMWVDADVSFPTKAYTMYELENVEDTFHKVANEHEIEVWAKPCLVFHLSGEETKRLFFDSDHGLFAEARKVAIKHGLYIWVDGIGYEKVVNFVKNNQENNEGI